MKKLNKHVVWNNKRLCDRSSCELWKQMKIRICAFEEKSESYLRVCGQRLTVGSFPQSPSFLSFRYGNDHLWVKLAVIWETFACHAHQCRCGGGDGLGTVRASAAKSTKSTSTSHYNRLNVSFCTWCGRLESVGVWSRSQLLKPGWYFLCSETWRLTTNWPRLPQTLRVILLRTVGVHIKHVLSSDQLINNNNSAQLFLLETLLLHVSSFRISECRSPPVKGSSSPPSSGASVDLLSLPRG